MGKNSELMCRNVPQDSSRSLALMGGGKGKGALLTDHDVVKWDDLEKREDSYEITEDSTPARLGSSLGWLLQSDCDNLRNAFLNAPWVKAVIPIRPGREKAA